MSDTYKVAAIDDMESIWKGSYKKARAALELDAFGLGVQYIPPDFDRMPPHVHLHDGQEEVYVAIDGSGWIELGAGDEAHRAEIDTGLALRVGPAVTRRPIGGPDGLTVVIVGGTPGRAYESFAPMEGGAPEPNPKELPGVVGAVGHESGDDSSSVAMDQVAITGVVPGVAFSPVGKALGTEAFGMALIEIEPGDDSNYPIHSHESDGQTEVYVVTEGEGRVVIDGATVSVKAGEMISIAPEAVRQWFAEGDETLRLLVFGAPSGKPYEGNSPTQL